MTGSIPMNIWLAANAFKKKRADYYEYFAAILRSSGGGIKIIKMFENDAARYEGKSRGIMSEYWLQRYTGNGANLADTWDGTLPEDEVAVVRVAQEAGGDALIVAIEDLSRMARLTDKVKQQSLLTLASALVGVAIALSMLFIFPIFSVELLKKTYDFVPMEYWGKSGKNFVAYADSVMSYGLYAVLIVLMGCIYMHWTFANLTNPIREWLDGNNVLYRTMRDLRGALFLSTMCTLTKRRGNTMFTLKQSLEIFMESARTPWLKWRIGQIIDGTDATGAVDIVAFKTGLLSDEMFYFLEDMASAKGFAEGLDATGKYVESNILQTILKRMATYRWVMLLTSLAFALGMFIWYMQVIYGMRNSMTNYLASG